MKEMALEEPAGSRADFLARLQQFMDRTLKDLDRAAESKDADETDIQSIRNVLLKIARIWKDAVANARDDSQPRDPIVPESRNRSNVENRES